MGELRMALIRALSDWMAFKAWLCEQEIARQSGQHLAPDVLAALDTLSGSG